MAKKRQSFSKDFKANVTLEALREESTLQEIAVKHGVHPNQISQWKSQAIAGMADIFERPNKESEETRKKEEEKDSLLKTIGEQKVEIDFLKKSTSRYTAMIQSCRTCLQGFKHFKAVQAAWDFTEPVLLQTGLRA